MGSRVCGEDIFVGSRVYGEDIFVGSRVYGEDTGTPVRETHAVIGQSDRSAESRGKHHLTTQVLSLARAGGTTSPRAASASRGQDAETAQN